MPSKSRLENEVSIDHDPEDSERSDSISDNAPAQHSPNSDTTKEAKPIKKTSSIARILNTNRKKADDPFRFQGAGVDYKAKLIGIREVNEARGDMMCQEAMTLCKASAKASGQHKQRILFNISIEGLKIKDDKSGNELYQFPVAKVSFIARDTTDPRAFGFVYGTPDSKHKFYAIKTAQTSDHAVLSIRDMFHIVYEMKKKQMAEKQGGSVGSSLSPLNSPSKDQNANNVAAAKESCVVADLLDLQSELDNIQHATDQLEQMQLQVDSNDWSANFDSNSAGHSSHTPYSSSFTVNTFSSMSAGVSAAQLTSSGHHDPFGDSFVPTPTPQQQQSVPPSLPGPPPTGRSHNSPRTAAAQNNSFDAWTTSPPQQQHQNPFASIAVAPVPTADPFDTSSFQNMMLQPKVSAPQPIQQSIGDPFAPSSREPVKSLDDAFSKLVDFNTIVNAPAQTTNNSSAKNPLSMPFNATSDPFAHIKRAQAPPLSQLRGEPTPSLKQPVTTIGPSNLATGGFNGMSTNPFADFARQPTAATAGNADPFANDPFFS